MARNQCGKTYAVCAGIAAIATGLYDETPGYNGKRWDIPVTIIIGGQTSELVRDSLQLLLLGEFEFAEDDSSKATLSGTGLIPGHLIGKYSRKKAPSDCIDTVFVKHVSGGWSKLMFKSYDQGYRKFSAKTGHLVVLDEDPGFGEGKRIIEESKMRVQVYNGDMWFSLTPTEGVTPVVERFYPEPPTPNRKLIMSGLDDDETLTEERKKQILEECEEDERQCRLYGHPYQGEGKVYTCEKRLFVRDSHEYRLPPLCTYARMFDFGYSNFFCLWGAYDQYKDVLYILDEYTNGDQMVVYHAAQIKLIDKRLFGKEVNLVTQYPHDGHAHNDEGESKRETWEKHGIRFADDFAHYLVEKVSQNNGKTSEMKSNSTQLGITDIRDRMRSARLIIDSRCQNLIRQIDYYHFKDGKIVKINDHGCDALRVGAMTVQNFEPVDLNIGITNRIVVEQQFDVLALN